MLKDLDQDAVQASGDAQVPGVRQVGVRRGGEAGRGLQVAQGLLQVLHVQQDAGQHQQQRQGQQALLQGESSKLTITDY